MSIPHILLVVGEPEATQLATALRQSQVAREVLVASSTDDGLREARRRLPEVIVVETALPGMDGAAFVTPSAGRSRPPLVFLLREASLEKNPVGVAGVIVRPVDYATFGERLRTLAERAWFARKFADLADLGGNEFIAAMIDALLDLVPLKLAQAEAALQAQQWTELARAAHSIKSAAANVGAEPLCFAATALDDRATARATPAELARQLDDVKQAFDRARQLLLRYQSSGQLEPAD